MYKYLPYLSFSKILNFLLVFISYHLSRLIKKPVVWGLPIGISIEPTTACNLKCPECPSGLRSFTRATGNLKQDDFKKIIADTKQHLMHLTFYFQGEPYINPNFLEMVKFANKHKIFTITSTNAHFLTDEIAQKTIESGLDELIISLDGTTQETYEKYRIEGNLNKVIEGTKNMVKWKKKLNSSKPRLIFQFLVVKPNEHEIEDAKKLTKDLGVDEIKFKTAQVYDFENGNPLIPSIEKYARYKKGKDGKYRIKNKLLNQCWKMWHACVVTWNGNIVPCCFDKDAKYVLGNGFSTNLKEVWKNKSYTNFRNNLLKGRKNIDICKNCSEGTKVWDSVE